MAKGLTETDIIKKYPGVSKEDVLACLEYASERLKSEKVIFQKEDNDRNNKIKRLQDHIRKCSEFFDAIKIHIFDKVKNENLLQISNIRKKAHFIFFNYIRVMMYIDVTL